jgi:hypothetical protein
LLPLVLVDAGRLTLDAPLAGRRYTRCQLLQAVAFAPVHDQGLVEQRVVEIARGIGGGERE